MEYKEVLPTNELLPFVKCFWEYQNKDRDIQHTIFPNGHFELFMIFEKQNLATIFLSGLRTKPFDVEINKGITVFSIRFKLTASEYIFNLEISPYLDAIRPLDLSFWNLQQIEHLSFNDRIIEITKRISEIIKAREIDQKKMALLEMVYAPDLIVTEISNTIQWDSRKINRYFNNQFGISLKKFLNIVRLRLSFESVKEGQLYPSMNYFDQSHYIKEVKKYTGKSPKQLSKNIDDRFLQLSVKRKP